ncbi:MAG: HNH endonuclease [Acidobacteria bacterium]|nr:HNH endonuclease [Acidobacteriota bacterium]
MPQLPPKGCSRPGCREVARARGLCAGHLRAWDRTRGTATERLYDWRWARASKAFLAAHPWCARCDRAGQLRRATMTDHIVPHKGDPVRFWDETNWQPLCGRCNRQKAVEHEGGFGRPRTDAATRPGGIKSLAGRVAQTTPVHRARDRKFNSRREID